MSSAHDLAQLVAMVLAAALTCLSTESEGRLAGRPSLRLVQPSVQAGLSESPSELPSVPKLPVHVNSVTFPWVIVKL